tara:strand:- start:2592 stop:3218 length:627 start_codon:yes stop_codon:yes gene_type:complete
MEKNGFTEELQKKNLKDGNLSLWNRVQETDPNYTKAANVKGNRITSISPQFQILNVTKEFGIYGMTWGLKDMKYDYTLVDSHGLVIYVATFFYPNGEFKINNSISLYIDNARTKVDDNFAKKLETDTLTKAISKLGFNADIFMGKFDDQRYLEDVKKKYAPKKTMNDDMFNKYLKALEEGNSKLTIREAKEDYQFKPSQLKELEDFKK